LIRLCHWTLPTEEIEKFVNGEPSIVDKFLQDKQLTLEALETSGNNAQVVAGSIRRLGGNVLKAPIMNGKLLLAREPMVVDALFVRV
jgi:hypothetical protein